MRARWGRMAPLGAPVVPPVKKMAAGASLSTFAAGVSASPNADEAIFGQGAPSTAARNSSRTMSALARNFAQQPITAGAGSCAGSITATRPAEVTARKLSTASMEFLSKMAT